LTSSSPALKLFLIRFCAEKNPASGAGLHPVPGRNFHFRKVQKTMDFQVFKLPDNFINYRAFFFA
jgi:hypothetical protein